MKSQALALELKEQGNTLVKEKQYEAAIQKYDEALVHCPTMSILHSNKARCFRELKLYEQSYASAEQAVQLDDKNIKAYFLMGETLVQIAIGSKDKTKIEEAIQKLKKSLRLCPSQGKTEFEQRFVDEIYKAKKKLWLMEVEANEEKKKALRSYLSNMVEGDAALSETQKDQLHENITTLVDKKYGVRQAIPRALVCPITKTLMKDPICNEHGNSYSRKAYYSEVLITKKDPLTGKPIANGLVYPNINLKKAIERFLDDNPWAYDEPVL